MDASQTLPRRADDQRVHDILNVYAEDLVRAELRIQDLEADMGTYREIALALMDALRDVTVTNQYLTNQNQQLRDDNRALYEALHVQCEAAA